MIEIKEKSVAGQTIRLHDADNVVIARTDLALGASMKGGTGPLMEVYRYAEPVTQNGFVFMDTPGFDPCSATGQQEQRGYAQVSGC